MDVVRQNQLQHPQRRAQHQKADGAPCVAAEEGVGRQRVEESQQQDECPTSDEEPIALKGLEHGGAGQNQAHPRASSSTGLTKCAFTPHDTALYQ